MLLKYIIGSINKIAEQYLFIRSSNRRGKFTIRMIQNKFSNKKREKDNNKEKHRKNKPF